MSTESEPEPGWSGSARPSPSDRPRAALLALVVGPTAKPTCTLYPPGVAVPYRSTTWITAHGDAFVSLDECR